MIYLPHRRLHFRGGLTLPWIDDFDRANEDPLVGEWDAAGAAKIVSNAVVWDTSSAWSFATKDIGVTDQVVQAAVTRTAGTSDPCLIVRYVDTSNYFIAYPYNSSIVLADVSGGTWVATTSGGYGGANSGTLKLEAKGTSIKAYWDGGGGFSLIAELTRSSHASSTIAGMGAYNGAGAAGHGDFSADEAT